MEHSLFNLILLVLALSVGFVAAFLRLGLSPILAYLLVGVVAGPSGFGWLRDDPATRFLAELGVIFLLFEIGLEFSLSALLAAKRLVLGLGLMQVLISGSIFGGAAWAMAGLEIGPAIIVGGALAMSSTAIVLKQLREQLEVAAPHGRIAVAVLLLQDLATIPLLVLVSTMGGKQANGWGELPMALGTALVLFVLFAVLGRKWLRPVLHYVAETRSLELFMLTALLLALAAAWISQHVGFPPALGAFMAGMLIGETEFRHQIETDISPFKDLLLGLFFITIGMQVDLVTVGASLFVIIPLLALYLVTKGLIVTLLAQGFGQSFSAALRAGIVLSQAGEFGLLLVTMTMSHRILTESVGQLLLAGMLLSMVLAPFIVRVNRQIAEFIIVRGRTRWAPDEREEEVAAVASGLEHHVVICGYGRIGQRLWEMLEWEKIPAIALDLDPERVRQARALGRRVVLGHATRPGVLHAAAIDRARALVITMADARLARQIITQVRLGHPKLPILARCAQERDWASLKQAGATEVFLEGLETSLAFVSQCLVMVGVPHSRVERYMSKLRAERYRPFRVLLPDSDRLEQEESETEEELSVVILEEKHFAVGKRLADLRLETTGASLTHVRRGGVNVPSTMMDTRLRPGDVLILEGSPESILRAKALLYEGG
ncbi:MAG: potassium transporter [Nitrospirae bacterium]|nr:MAG: potassium transporter [Nitrospirota bacterium]